ncbi:hypothetical protein L798_14288 [Zootermopsis nevadensis]|uniref:Uncharacterized protein n=1 Tax=Zootermopsis nevadensis TaxID=136037 RepID=A0A067QZI4_ZOONE|nr:hypothetical protein L798_14288 [Zootermopsis nevadensis]
MRTMTCLINTWTDSCESYDLSPTPSVPTRNYKFYHCNRRALNNLYCHN